MAGQLFFVVGPSGAGKDTLLAGAVAQDSSLVWAQRCITRPALAGGEPFAEMTEPQFQAALAAGDFALHWAAHGLHYGVSHAALAPLQQGKAVLLNGSRGAILMARAAFPDMRVILVTAPIDVLAKRLSARGRETQSDIAARLERAGFELPKGVFASEVINDSTPEIGVARLLQAIKG